MNGYHNFLRMSWKGEYFMGRKIGIGLAGLFFIAGLGILLVPIVSKKNTQNMQQTLTKEYEFIVKENQKKKEVPTPKPQDEQMDYAVADFVEENSNDETKEIIERQHIIGMITCKEIGLRYVVVEGANRDNIRATIGHITGTAGFGGKGNCVLAGHRGGYYGEFFKNIHKLSNGDLVVLNDIYNRTYTYVVYEQKVVEPEDVWICDSVKGQDTLTLLSCEDDGTKRRIVRCKLEKKVLD